MKKYLFVIIIAFLFVHKDFGQVFQWAKQQNTGAAGTRKVVADQNGNSYFLGTFGGSIQFNTVQGNVTFTSQGASSSTSTNIFLTKADANGTIQWARQINGTILGIDVWDNLYASIALDNMGNLIVCGKFNGSITAESYSFNSSNNHNGFVAKYNCTSGNIVNMFTLGGSEFDEINAVTAGNNGNYYIAGRYTTSLTLGTNTIARSGTGDYYAGFNSSDNCIWLANGNSNNRPANLVINKQDQTQGYLSYENQNTTIKKIDLSTGTINNLTNSPVFAGTYITSIGTDNNGNIIASGIYVADGQTGQTTPNQVTVAGKILNAPFIGYSHIVFLCSIDNTGQRNWAMNTGSNCWSNPGTNPKLSVDANNQILLTNTFSETANLGVGTNVNSSGATDILITKYNNAGTLLKYKQPISGYYDNAADICASTNGNIFLAGSSVSQINFDGFVLNGANGSDAALMVKMNTSINTLSIAQTICKGGTVNVPFTLNDNLNTANTFTVELSNATGSFASPVTIGTYTSSVAGTYTVSATIPTNTPSGTGYRIRVRSTDPALIGTDNGSDLTISSLIILTVNPANTAVCTGSTAILTASGAQSYNWTGGITNGTAFNPTTSQIYTVTGTDTNGCMATAVSNVTVNPLPTVTATASSSGICNGSQSTITANGASNYVWSTGATSSSINVSSTGTYSVTGTNANGCQSSASTSITVNPSATVSIYGNTEVCPNTTTVLDAGAGFASYLWSNGATTQTINAGVGTFSVTVTNSYGCSATSSIQIIQNTHCSGIPCSGGTINNMLNTAISANNVIGALAYRFTFYNTNGTQTLPYTQASRTVLLRNVTGLTYNQSYNVSVEVQYTNTAGVVVWSPKAYRTCPIVFAEPTALYSCSGVSINNLINTVATCTSIWGATHYRFTLTNTNGTQLPSITRTSNSFYYHDVPGIAYNQSYQMAVEVEYLDVTGTPIWGPSSGNVCTVNIGIPIAAYSCPGVSINNLINTVATCTSIWGATHYRFILTNTNGTQLPSITRTSNSFYYHDVPGIAYNQSYQMAVEVEYPNVNGTPVWGPSSGNVCTVNFGVPVAPITCPASPIANPTTAYAICTNIWGAQHYRFTLTSTNGIQLGPITKVSNSVHYNEFPGIDYAQTYQMATEIEYVNANGIPVYGTALSNTCMISFATPNARIICPSGSFASISGASINCTSTSGVLQYNFKVKKHVLDSEIVFNWKQASSKLYFQNIPGLENNQRYDVDVSVQFKDSNDSLVLGPYSNSICTVTFGNPTSKLKPENNTQSGVSHDNAVLIYPNPTNGLITISTEKVISKITVYDYTGKPVKEYKTEDQLDLTQLEPGMYMIEFQTKDSRENIRIIKQ